MIEVKNLSKQFVDSDNKSFHAVDDVSFKVNKGEIFGIIGKSGAGKSTLIRLINRLEEPDSGEIIFEGEDITKIDKKDLLEKRKEISMIFQNFNLFNQKSVRKNISFPMELLSFSQKEIDEKVNSLLDFVGLKNKKNNYPQALSGGERQRVAIARALALNPKLLLSDESTSALDPSTTKQILNLLKKVVDDFETSIIMITHQMEVAKEICDRIAVMQDGKIIEIGDVKTIFENPKHQLTKSFINNLKDDYDQQILESDFNGSLLRLFFDEATYDKPIISNVIKETGADISIISGNLSKLRKERIGSTIVEVIHKGEIDEIINKFRLYKVKVEVIR